MLFSLINWDYRLDIVLLILGKSEFG